MTVVITRARAFISEIPQIELEIATSLVTVERIVEIPGRCSPLDAPSRPEEIVLQDLWTLRGYATTTEI